MKIIALSSRLFTLGFFLLFFTGTNWAQHSVVSTYSPAHFADANRLQKIKATEAIVKKMYEGHAQKMNFPGFVYGVVADGKLVYAGGVGYSDIEQKIKATASSAFRIASMTKSVTALAIVQLRDGGKLALDDAAEKYIPELKSVKYVTSDAPVITIRHLLTHAAGFPEDNPWGDRQLADTDDELLQLITNDVQFSNVPGAGYEYSNLGFALLGRLVSVVSGKPYQQYIIENILKPLGMNDTYWEWDKVPKTLLAHGYRFVENKWREEALLHDGAFGAMGGLITTINDFEKYMALHLSAWPASNGQENPVLRRSSLREMQTTGTFSRLNAAFRYPDGRLCPTASLYAYGLIWTKDCAGRIGVGHSGGLPGFGSNWQILPEYGIGVVCFANLTYAPTAGINTAVIDTIIKEANLNLRTLPASPILQQRKEQLTALLPHLNNAETSGLFAENFFLDHSIKEVKANVAAVFEKAGTILKVGELIPQNNLRGSFILNGEKANIEVFFTLTPEKIPLIQELQIREHKR